MTISCLGGKFCELFCCILLVIVIYQYSTEGNNSDSCWLSNAIMKPLLYTSKQPRSSYCMSLMSYTCHAARGICRCDCILSVWQERSLNSHDRRHNADF